MRETLFRFKHFNCHHGKSSMKIGVDAVLIGAWADVTGKQILDVGTGCGVIALMCAQRNQAASIFAIDIDFDSIIEAKGNFVRSPWSDRIRVTFDDFINHSDNIPGSNYDLIISNPPYFNSGITDPDTPRLVARHQAQLCPDALIRYSRKMLSEKGRLAMIVPLQQKSNLIEFGSNHGMYIRRFCEVRDYPGAPVKRIMLEFATEGSEYPEGTELIMFKAPFGEPTDNYRELCKDFYLKF